MKLPDAVGRQVLEVLRGQLIPWVSGGAPFVLLNAPPQSIGSATIAEQTGRKLAQKRGSGQKVRVQSWPEENLNVMAAPYMGCVVEGEADIITGTTAAMCRKLKIPGKRWVLNAPQKTFFLAPPGVPISRGERVHWERPQPENAYSRILWIQFHTTGVSCHFCTSDKGKHWSHPYCFIYGNEFLPLIQTLTREMTLQAPQYVPLAYFHLNILLHYMMRSLLAKRTEESREALASSNDTALRATDALIQQALAYIDQQLHENELTVEKVAARVLLSPRHLAHIFQRDMGTTVMGYATKRRMELACQLLIESEFGIAKIGGYCGYSSASSFIKAFVRYAGVSPANYRAARRSVPRFETISVLDSR